MSDEEDTKNKCQVCKKQKAQNICEHCTGRYGGVSMHLKQFSDPLDCESLQRAILEGTLERAPDAPGPNQKTGKPDPKIRSCPTVDDLVVEEDELPNRIWEWNPQKNMPVTKTANDGRIVNPPWGTIDIPSMVKDHVPIGMVGSGLLYFNAAKYKAARFKQLLDMLDIINLPKDQFVMYEKEAADPMEEGFLTMWRFVSREAYQEYHHQKFEADPNPDRKQPKKALYATLTKTLADEMKKYGKGKKIWLPKPEKAEGEEEEEEPEEEEEEKDETDLKGREALNEKMGLTGFAKNFGEWALGFGFLVESDHYKTYRMWSRPIFHPMPPVKPDPNKKEWS